MPQESSQLLVTSWLDDEDGPAKLTARQLELSSNDSTDLDSTLSKIFEPQWQPNAVISMFHKEKQRIVKRGDECQRLLDETTSVLETMLSLEKLYQYVSPGTSQLHTECNAIIQERNNLKESYDRAKSSLIREEESRSIYRRSPEIRNQILSILNTVSQKYQNDTSLSQQDQSLDEYYGRFFVECRRIRELNGQLESCISDLTAEGVLLHLEEIYTVYFEVREQLMEPAFTSNLRNLISKADRNYCELLRQTCNSLVRAIRNEVQLFNQIFNNSSTTQSTPPDPVTNSQTQAGENIVKRQAPKPFLELLCRKFYEHLRPVVIHVNHLETLMELYKLINESMKPEVLEECYQKTMISLAEDVQERMLFRAEIFIQESILNYNPSAGDLAYPEKFEIISGQQLKSYQSMWYPTVQRTVSALFYLNRVFDEVTFKDLAQEAAIACLNSLNIAQRLIDERHGGTRIEADLFKNKHVEILEDQLKSYNIQDLSFLTEEAK